jgi:drug/metabolite transporter (DMT)-like permease
VVSLALAQSVFLAVGLVLVRHVHRFHGGPDAYGGSQCLDHHGRGAVVHRLVHPRFFASPIAFAHLVALCVPIAGAVQWTLAQKSQSDGHSLDLVPSVLLGAIFSTLLTLPLAMPFQASAHDVGLLATLGLFQLAIPCVLSVICVRVLKAPEASLLCLLEIVFGIALAWWGANESPQMSVLLGGSLVLGALLMNQWLGWKQNNV